MRSLIELEAGDLEMNMRFLMSNHEESSMILNGSGENSRMIAGFGVLDEISQSIECQSFAEFQKSVGNWNDWSMGYLTYDLKNETENLSSDNCDGLNFPALRFFRPRYVLVSDESGFRLEYDNQVDSHESALNWYRKLTQSGGDFTESDINVQLTARESRESYLEKVRKLKEHIQLGDIYEVNFCQEFYAEDVNIAPEQVYQALNSRAQAPFSCFMKDEGRYVMCASPGTLYEEAWLQNYLTTHKGNN